MADQVMDERHDRRPERAPAHAYNRVQLVINRTTEAVEYNRIPQETRDASLCRPFTNELFKWTLEDQAVALRDGL